MNRLLDYFIAFLITLFLLQSTMTHAEPLSTSEPAKLTGAWNGMRTSLLNQGIRINAFYTGEVISNVNGGIRQQSTYLDIVEMMITSNFDEIAPWKGTTFYINAMGTHGKNPGDSVGDLQGISNIAAPNMIKIHEIWLQQNYQNDRFSILFGLYDLNSEFDVLDRKSVV